MPREAVVLAAGFGGRFRSGRHKLLAKISGYHLIEYPMRSIAAAGVTLFLVVTNSLLRGELDPVIRKVIRDVGIEVELVVNNYVDKGNAYSLLLGLTSSRDTAPLVTVADHVYPSTLVEGVLRGYSGTPLAVGGDRNPRYADVAEATLVEADQDGVIKSMGKNLASWSHVDTGLHVVSVDVLNYAGLCGPEGELASLYGCLSRTTRRGVVVDVTGNPWKDVDTWDDYLGLVEGKDRAVADSAVESWRK